jgi:uncharacterized protein YceH (UPF0502 family)
MEKAPPRWQAVSAIDRRVLGSLVEKAKTTPDAYPMSVNALTTAANQKNNRYPLMQLEVEDLQESLDRLRELGAIAEVQGGGRVPRFRHYMYEWLGVEKVELAVMAELLLRGAQTEGELRGRAARMEPIADLNALRVVLDSLRSKQLVISLTPEGRGQVITHNLYLPRELEKLHAEYHAVARTASADESTEETTPAPTAKQLPPAAKPPVASHDDLGSLRQEVATLRRELEELREEFQATQSEFRQLRDQLG